MTPVEQAHEMDVDLVYTWVNPQDERLNAQRRLHMVREAQDDLEYRAGEARYRDWGELRESLKTSRRYLPFLRNTYVVHFGEAPDWLKGAEGVILVPNENLVPAALYPSFQSDVVEAFLHKIPGLSERYIYSNDDCFFSQPHQVGDFFSPDGKCRLAVSERLATMGPVGGTFKEMERNSVRSLQRRLKISQPAPTADTGLSLYEQAIQYLKAMKRGVRLMNTFTHVTQPFLKSHWVDFHSRFNDDLAPTLHSRFRTSAGVMVNFMYLHFLRSLERAEFYYDPRHRYIDWRDTELDRERLFQLISLNMPSVTRYCVNDHPADAEGDRGWRDYHQRFMKLIATRMAEEGAPMSAGGRAPARQVVRQAS